MASLTNAHHTYYIYKTNPSARTRSDYIELVQNSALYSIP